MAKAPSELTSPSLHDQWSKAKKAAKKAATDLDKKNKDKKKTQEKAYAELAKKAFNKDLGPNLDKWIKLYPEYAKMEKLRTGSINPALKGYIDAAKSSGLDKSVHDPLVKVLNGIAKEQKSRGEKAEQIIGSDMSLAIKESKQKIAPPIVVFKHSNILKPVASRVGKLQNIDMEGSLAIEVIIADKEILSKFPEGSNYTNQAQKIKDAGDFSKLVGDIADAVKEADKAVGKGTSIKAAQSAVEKKIREAIDDSVDRATEEAGRLGKLKGKAKWANVKRGGKLVLTIAGAAAGVVGLALTPLTFGASTVAGCIGLAKAGVEIGKQLADIASSAEMMANGIAKDLNTLKKQYNKWLQDPEVKKAGGVSNKMGMAELGKRGLNSLAPTMLTTLKSVKDDAGTYDEYIDNLEVKADKLGDNLDKWLTNQEKANKAFKEAESKGKDELTDKEFKAVLKILSTIAKTEKQVGTIITNVTKLNGRVAKNRKNSKKLNAELKAISVKNPLWSDIGSAIFEVTSSVAFTLAGNVNAPDPYKFAKQTADIVSAVDTTREQLQQAADLAEKLKDAHEKRVKKMKA